MRRRKGTGGELKRRERERRGGEMREKGRGRRKSVRPMPQYSMLLRSGHAMHRKDAYMKERTGSTFVLFVCLTIVPNS